MRRRPFAELVKDLRADPAHRAEIAQYRRAIEDALALAELRQECGVTQREVAAALNVSQANVARIEHEEDLYLSTLRAYVAALGGELELTAVFPDRTVTLFAGPRT